MIKTKTIAATGAILCALAVVFGAFGAHSLKAVLLENGKLETFQTAVNYHIFHGLAILVLAALKTQFNINKHVLIFWLFLGGLILFSGSLYILSITGINKLGIITPFGGVLFIVAWLVLALQLFKK